MTIKNNNREFILISKKSEAENITSLFFKTAEGLGYDFLAGQYVDVKPQSDSSHSKSYTISSSPGEKLVCITVKRIGNTSSALIDFPIGGKLTFDGPYGHFYPDLFPQAGGNDLVMIAGGIGITPFYSIIKNRFEYDNGSNNKDDKSDNNKICLFYSNKTMNGTAFFDGLNMLVKKNQQFKVVYTLTQEKTKHSSVQEYTRINAKILKKHLTSLDKKDYYICGSIQFVNDMWKLLKDNDVQEANIFTESFF